jgi:hypothetical protein
VYHGVDYFGVSQGAKPVVCIYVKPGSCTVKKKLLSPRDDG